MMAGFGYLDKGDIVCSCLEPLCEDGDVVIKWEGNLYHATEYKCRNCGRRAWVVQSMEFTNRRWAQKEVAEAKTEGVFRDLDEEDQQ